MDVTYAWAKGAKFSAVCGMTDVFEGSIAREGTAHESSLVVSIGVFPFVLLFEGSRRHVQVQGLLLF